MFSRYLAVFWLAQTLLSNLSSGVHHPTEHDSKSDQGGIRNLIWWGENQGFTPYFLLGLVKPSSSAFILSVNTTLRVPSAPALRSDGAFGIYPGLQNYQDDLVQSVVAVLSSNTYKGWSLLDCISVLNHGYRTTDSPCGIAQGYCAFSNFFTLHHPGSNGTAWQDSAQGMTVFPQDEIEITCSYHL